LPPAPPLEVAQFSVLENSASSVAPRQNLPAKALSESAAMAKVATIFVAIDDGFLVDMVQSSYSV